MSEEKSLTDYLGKKVSQYYRHNILMLSESVKISEACTILKKKDVDEIIVVDDSYNPVGIVTCMMFYLINIPNSIHFMWDECVKKIVFYWEKVFNCNFNRGLLASFKGIKNPEIHKEFGELYYLNDSTIKVNYYYKDWINAINNLEKSTIDTLFPSTFKRIIL